MTKAEFNEIFRTLVAECFVPRETMDIWATAISDLDVEDVRKNIQQYREAKRFGCSLVCLPAEVRKECLEFHGYDKQTWDAIREACGLPGGGIYV